ncbi:hypothetical protein [Apibacter adventoris]|uniref:hypothetical protein n=1 Tax=Apibacter adventoris TaxID=1679466 RepID=UPI000CF715F6|nr:hypothetical protein [Apibacter adventoris]PQL95934.1 hypothetical protein C4S76_00080 [Apibacter adventoris]
MKLKDLKKYLDNMSNEELDQELIYNSDNYCMYGKVINLKKAKENLCYAGEDDSAQSYTREQLINDCYNNSLKRIKILSEIDRHN